MKRGKNEQVVQAVARAEERLLDEDLDGAFALIDEAIAAHDHVRLYRFKKRLLLMRGDEAAATQLFRQIEDFIARPTPGELALVRSGRSAFTGVEAQKLLYLHVPKCGSTTVKDMLYHVLTGKRVEGHSHSKMLEQAPYKILQRSALAADYGDWFKFLVVRDPISRLRSYYRFNLVFTDDLSKEVGKRDTYMGLKLQPKYDEFLKNLHRYRQIFPTLRAHTNLISDIAGDELSVYDWIGPVSRMGDLRKRLSEKTGAAIPEIHNFRSKDMVAFEPAPALEDKVRDFYARDYEVFGDHYK